MKSHRERNTDALTKLIPALVLDKNMQIKLNAHVASLVGCSDSLIKLLLFPVVAVVILRQIYLKHLVALALRSDPIHLHY